MVDILAAAHVITIRHGFGVDCLFSAAGTPPDLLDEAFSPFG